MKTPDPTPAFLSAARLADTIRTVRGALRTGSALQSAALDRLVAHLDAITPCDREQGGRLVRKVWIDWAKEQPCPKTSWLVEWEGLSEPDKEVDRRIFEACFASGRSEGAADLLAEVNRLLTLEYTSASDIAEHVIRLEAADEARITGEETIARLTRELADRDAQVQALKRPDAPPDTTPKQKH